MPKRAWLLLAVVVLTAGFVRSEDLGPESNRRDLTFASEEATRDRIFGPNRVWNDSSVLVDASARAELARKTGLHEDDSVVLLHWTPGPDGRREGVYRVAREIGKYLPFDFFVALDGQLAVKEVVVLAYRESRGGQVQRARFMSQFRGKTASSPLSLNRDVIGISGATLSAQAVARGVKKTLWWAGRLFEPDQEAP